MTPAAISLIIGLVQEAITASPTIVADFQQLFAGGNVPTAAQWEALKASVLAQSFQSLAPDVKLS